MRSLLVPKTCHLVGWVLHIGALGDHGPIQGHLGAEERRPYSNRTSANLQCAAATVCEQLPRHLWYARIGPLVWRSTAPPIYEYVVGPTRNIQVVWPQLQPQAWESISGNVLGDRRSQLSHRCRISCPRNF